jgi:hypothetical protein
MAIFLTFICGCLFTVGDVLIKYWILSSRWIYFIIAVAFWTFGCLFGGYAMKYKSIIIISMMAVLFNIITLFFVSRFWFKEIITRSEYIGLILGILSLVFIHIKLGD